MRLKNLTLKDKELFLKYLGLKQRQLSVYSFPNIYIWKGLFKIFWAILDHSLCVFFQDKLGCFLYLPPLGKTTSFLAVSEAFKIMDRLNPNPLFSRIENVQEKDLGFYRRLGYSIFEKPPEYLYQRRKLVDLKGSHFKGKRSGINYFCKNYTFTYLPFTLKDKKDCLALYCRWQEKRRSKNADPIYQGLLTESQKSLEVLLRHYRHLGLLGRVVKIENKVSAFTFGFPLSKNTFCILYEITESSLKGLSQFIFRRFCQELKEYEYINVMDDAGLENLRRVKLSYQPLRLIFGFIISRNA